MEVQVAYGREGLWIDLPAENVTVVQPTYLPGLDDEQRALREALRNPIGTPPVAALVGPTDTVAIVFSDLTRPQPRRRMLSVLLDELAAIPSEQVVLINALGSHRPNTGTELVEMLGPEIVDKYRIVQHNAFDRESNELWKKSMDAIGIRIEFQQGKFADHLKAAKVCQLMMWGASWLADYPDGENFMQLLYGPNTGQSNNGCYESKAFDAFYREMLKLGDSPERNRLFLEMTRQMEVDGAWSFGVSRERNQILWPWVLGYKKHPIMNADFIFLDLAPRT